MFRNVGALTNTRVYKVFISLSRCCCYQTHHKSGCDHSWTMIRTRTRENWRRFRTTPSLAFHTCMSTMDGSVQTTVNLLLMYTSGRIEDHSTNSYRHQTRKQHVRHKLHKISHSNLILKPLFLKFTVATLATPWINPFHSWANEMRRMIVELQLQNKKECISSVPEKWKEKWPKETTHNE